MAEGDEVGPMRKELVPVTAGNQESNSEHEEVLITESWRSVRNSSERHAGAQLSEASTILNG